MDVRHVAKLANLPLKKDEEEIFSQQFADTLKTVDLINELDTSKTLPTSQVTGLVNVTREDVIDKTRMFSQDLALSQAHKSHKGYFVVPAVFEDA